MKRGPDQLTMSTLETCSPYSGVRFEGPDRNFRVHFVIFISRSQPRKDTGISSGDEPP